MNHKCIATIYQYIIQKDMENIITILINFIVAGGVTVFLFYQSRRRKEAATASAAEIENKGSEFGLYKEQIKFLNDNLQQAYTEIDKMQEIINRKRTDIIELIRRACQLEIDLTTERKAHQMAENHECTNIDCRSRERSESNG